MVVSKARRACSGYVDFPRFYGKAREPLKPLAVPPPIGGFDIEADAQTADPYLICASISDGKKFKKTLENAADVLNFLTMPSFKDSLNGFWNISYDTEGMLRFFPDFVKYTLSKNIEVYLTEDLKMGSKEKWYYHLKVIPKKAFFIRTVISPVISYFDWRQFFDGEPLNVVAKRLLGDEKEGFNAAESSSRRYFTEPDYYEKVRSYCLHDADLTQRIGAHLVRAVHSFLPTKNFTSRASLAGQYFLRNGYSVPPQMRFYFKWFLRTYWGGRFEMTKRGFVRDVFEADIKSAFPKWMGELFILTDSVELVQTKQDDWDPYCLYGAYKVSIQIPHDNYLGPVPVQRPGEPIIYPVGELEPAWVDKETLGYLHSRGYDFQIHEGAQLYDPDAKKLLREPVNRLFSIKENKKNDEGIRQTAKIMMNGGYGKTVELVDDVVGEILELEEALKQQLEIHKVLPEGVFTTRHTQRFRAGNMFCPPYASFITAKTRIQVLEMAEYVGFENVVAIQTDSLSSVNKAPKAEKGLGGWDYKGRCDLPIGKPGFYQQQESGEVGMEDAWKIFNTIRATKARSVGRINDISLPEYTVRRRISMKECASKADFTLQNLIVERTMKSNINTDQKRVWDAQLTEDDVRPWGRTIDSKPIRLSIS